MKSMQDKIPKKKVSRKTKKDKQAKQCVKGSRKVRAILDNTSDEDDFATSNKE